MSKRERNLALLVGLCLLALAAFFGARKVNEAIRARRQQIAAAEKAVRDKTQILRLSTEPAGRMEDYQRRSLPSDLEKARSLYQTWLLNLVKEAGFEDTQVSVLPARSEKGVYQVLGFSVSGRGNLPKLVSFLHRFYSADLLHRVRRLHVKRVPGTKQLDLAVAIDALSLPTADSTDKLNEDAVRKLAHGDVPAYLETILKRNLSGPANKEPTIEVPAEVTKYVGDVVAFAVKGRTTAFRPRPHGRPSRSGSQKSRPNRLRHRLLRPSRVSTWRSSPLSPRSPRLTASGRPGSACVRRASC
ncbi:MAG: hypothetical protein MUF25_26480 [Pirellulaceae bacterium]|nr:hypothetical protein [Pirellulaceae bacterium]